MSGQPHVRMTWGWRLHGLVASVDGHTLDLRTRPEWRGATRVSQFGGFVWGPELRRNEANLHDVLGFLTRPGPGRPEVLAALETMLPEGTVALFRSMPDAFGPLPVLSFYLDDRARGPGRRAVAASVPALARVIPHLARRTGLDRRRTLPDARTLLVAYAPDASPATVANVLGTKSMIHSFKILDALLAIPSDWHPERDGADPLDPAAFETVAVTTHRLASALDGHGHLASSGGRWLKFLVRAERAAQGRGLPEGGGIGMATSNALDAATALSDQVLLPALLAWGVLDERSVLWMRIASAPQRRHLGVRGEHAAARLLYGGKSLPAIFETSGRWHARQHAIAAAIASTGHATSAVTWPVPYAPVTAPNGVTMRFLSTRAELSAEGAEGAGPDGVPGLSHCVGGYIGACLDGSLSVMSLTVADGGGYRRLSTASLSLEGGTPTVTQHSGLANATPPPEAVEALDWFVREAGTGRLRPLPEYLAWKPERPDTVTLASLCGYDPLAPGAVEAALAAWAPLLPRPMRDMDGFLAAARPYLPRSSFPALAEWWRYRRPDVGLASAACLAMAVLAVCGTMTFRASDAPFATAFLGPVIALIAGMAMAGRHRHAVTGPALAASGLAMAVAAHVTARALGLTPYPWTFTALQVSAMAAVTAPAWAAHAGDAVATGLAWARASAFNRRRAVGATGIPPATGHVEGGTT